MTRIRLIAFVFVLAAFVAGCGGGAAAEGDVSATGQDGGVATTPNTAATTSTVSGTVPGDGTTDPGSALGGAGGTTLPAPPDGDVDGLGSLDDVAFSLDDEFTEPDATSVTDSTTTDTSSIDTTIPETPTESFAKVYNRARILVNGQLYVVKRKTVFPDDTQDFRVTSIDADGVTLELVAGEFANGSTGLSLNVGQRYRLVNQSEGENVVVKLVSVYSASTT